MSQQHIEKFYEIAANDQQLFKELINGIENADQFVENAVAAGKERGLDFSCEEASTWIASQQAAKADGELSDTQLEGVAGGKTSATRVLATIGLAYVTAGETVFGGLGDMFVGAAKGVEETANDIAAWFDSW